MKFQDLRIGQKFQIDGRDFVKVEERWEEPFSAVSAEDENGQSCWVDEREVVEVIK